MTTRKSASAAAFYRGAVAAALVEEVNHAPLWGRLGCCCVRARRQTARAARPIFAPPESVRRSRVRYARSACMVQKQTAHQSLQEPGDTWTSCRACRTSRREAIPGTVEQILPSIFSNLDFLFRPRQKSCKLDVSLFLSRPSILPRSCVCWRCLLSLDRRRHNNQARTHSWHRPARGARAFFLPVGRAQDADDHERPPVA